MNCILTKTLREAIWQAHMLQIIPDAICPDCGQEGIVWGVQQDTQPHLFYVCLTSVKQDLLISWYAEHVSRRNQSIVLME